MKKITLFLNGHPVAMFTFKGSLKNAETQAEFKRNSIAIQWKTNIEAVTYTIR